MSSSHIRFDTDDEDVFEIPIPMPFDNECQARIKLVTAVLVKHRNKKKNEKSFGFELEGYLDKNKISKIDNYGPAYRAGLKLFDRVVEVNGQCVRSYDINKLMDLIEYETSLNDIKLSLTIERDIAAEDETEKEKKTSEKKSRKRNHSEGGVSSDQDSIKKANMEEDNYDLDVEFQSQTLERLRQEKISQVSFISPQIPPYKLPHVPHKAVLNAKCREIQQSISEQGKYVLWQEVLFGLLTIYNCEHIGQLGLGQADHLEAIYELLSAQKRTDTLIIAFENRTPCVCLHDLEQAILSDYNFNHSKNSSSFIKKDRFDQLYIGPLVQNQIVRRIFKITDDIDYLKQLKPVRLGELTKSLVNFLQENNLWNTKVKQGDFEDYLKKKHQVDNINKLCIKINNLGGLISSLKTVQYSYSANLRTIKETLSIEVTELFERQKSTIISELENKIVNNKEKYFFKKDPADLMVEFLGLFKQMGVFSSFEDFFSTVYENSFLQDCFKLAICLAYKPDIEDCIESIAEHREEDILRYNNLLKTIFFTIHETYKLPNKHLKRFLRSYLNENKLKVVPQSYKKYENDSSDDEVANKISKFDSLEGNIPIYDEEKLINFIESKIESLSRLSLEDLLKIEQNAMANHSKTAFTDLLIKNKYLFLNKGINSIFFDNVDTPNHAEKDYSRVFVLDYVKQLYSSRLSDDEIHQRVIYFYPKLSDQKVKAILEEYTSSSSNYNDSGFVYFDSIFNGNLKSNSTTEMIEKVKLCPLLDDICDYLRQNYQISFLELKQLIFDYNRKISDKNDLIYLLEIDQNKLLKLTGKDLCIETLKSMIENGDYINSSGYLVSLLSIKYKCLSKAPRSLLVNEIQSSICELRKKCLNQRSSKYFKNLLERNKYKDLTSAWKFYDFFIKFLNRIPVIFIKQILFDYLLEPFASIEKDCRFRDHMFLYACIVSYCSNSDLDIKYLIKLGEDCSINEWSIDKYTEILSNLNKIDQNITESSCQIGHEPVQLKKVHLASIKQDETEMETDDPLNSMRFSEISAEPNVIDTVYSNDPEFNHIISIREKYGIGIEFDRKTKKVTDSLKGVIGRSLQSLSNELYNKDTHFILELIQNADDNSYLNDHLIEEPTLIFLVDNQQIHLFNNELGFNESNINAICDVKASTKSNQLNHGYIGRKGIGFKSVFTVSACPEIHSNGYHIRFELKNGHIGYILPNWIDPSGKIVKNIDNLKQNLLNTLKTECSINSLNTCIKLPLSPKSEKTAELINNFIDIKSYILLFLNRLKNLVIILNNKPMLYHRNDITDCLVQIKSISLENKEESFEDKWIVAKETLKVPSNIKQSNTNSYGAQLTDLCLAFPVYDKISNQNLPKLDVFAYLPLRSFGFTFIIQADFVVPASRQDLRQDSDWNQWIIKQIPKLFVDSLKYFKYEGIFNGFEWLISYLNFVPNESEILGIFQHVPREIIHMLQSESVLPVIDPNGNEIVWKKPFECIYLKQQIEENVNDLDLIKQVITGDLLKKYLGRYYLHDFILDSCKKKIINVNLLHKIGVTILNLNDIFEIIKTIFNESNSSDFLNDVTSTAKWLCILESCLNLNNFSIQQENLFFNKLKTIEFIPIIRNGIRKLASLQKSNVFLPSRIDEKLDGVSIRHSEVDKIIENDLDLVDCDSLLCMPDQIQNLRIIKLLKLLGCKEAKNQYEIIDKHILESFIPDGKNDKILIVYLLFIYNTFMNQQLNIPIMNRIKDTILIKCENSQFKKPSETYLTPDYGNRYNLSKMFPSYKNFNLIDSIYLKKYAEIFRINSQQQLVSGWRKFLLSLELNDIFLPERIDTYLNEEELFNSDQYSLYVNKIQKLQKFKNELYLIQNYDCKVFNHYITKIQLADRYVKDYELIKELRNLYSIIEYNWSLLESYKNCNIYITDFSCKKRELLKESLCNSLFVNKLKNTPWICVESQLCKSYIEIPSNVYVRDPALSRIYGENITYAINTPVSKEKSSLAYDLGFKFEFDLNEFFEILKNWCTTYNISNSLKFKASFVQMRNIYSLVASQLTSVETREGMRELCIDLIKQNIVFIPDDLGEFVENPEKYVEGLFYPVEHVAWSDPTGLFVKYNQKNIFLSDIYCDYNTNKNEQIKILFVNELKIKKSPSLDDLMSLLCYICSNNYPNKESTLVDVFRLYEKIYEECLLVDEKEKLKQLKLQLIDLKIIPCFGNKWTSPRENPILIDINFNIAEKFSPYLNYVLVNFKGRYNYNEFEWDLFNLANLKNPNILSILREVLNVKLFSEILILDLENISENSKEAPVQIKTVCCKILPFIQCFLSNKYSEIFKEFNEKIDKIKNIKFYTVQELQNVYRCKVDSKAYVKIASKTCFEINDKSAYWKYFIKSDLAENQNEIIRGFVKLFVKDHSYEKDLTNFCLLMNELSSNKLNIEDKKNIEKDYGLKLNLIKDSFENWGSISFEIMEVEEQQLVKAREVNSKESGRKKLLDYAELSRNQINVPVDFMPRQPTSYMDLSKPHSSNFNVNLDNIRENLDSIEINKVLDNSCTPDLLNSLKELKANSEKCNIDNKYAMQVGRLGEMLINEILQKKYKSEIQEGSIKVEWVNQSSESGLPYDIKITNTLKDQEEYIEVKSTSKMSRQYFQISMNELLFANEYSECFKIYRVYNVGNQIENVHYRVIEDVPKLLSSHELNLYMII